MHKFIISHTIPTRPHHVEVKLLFIDNQFVLFVLCCCWGSCSNVHIGSYVFLVWMSEGILANGQPWVAHEDSP